MATDKKVSELPDATLPISSGVKFEAVQGGINVKVDADDMPGGSGIVETIVAGANVTVDSTDPANPIVSASGGGGGAVDSVNGQTGVVQVNADDVPFTPAGSIAATDVQAAIEELDSEKLSSVPDASETVKGIIEIATQAETNTGTDDVRAVTPLKLSASTQWNAKSDSLVTTRTPVASHTLDSTDLASINAGDSLKILMNVASANTLTVPPNATVSFPTGTAIMINQYGAGATTIVAGAGVTIRNTDGLVLGGQYANAYVIKIGTNEWIAGGKLKL